MKRIISQISLHELSPAAISYARTEVTKYRIKVEFLIVPSENVIKDLLEKEELLKSWFKENNVESQKRSGYVGDLLDMKVIINPCISCIELHSSIVE